MKEKTTGLEETILRLYPNTAGIILMKDGEKRYESYFGGCAETDAIHVFSVTKSITSALFGIARDRGYIGSLDRKITEFFPDYTPKRGEKTLQNVTLRNMLTMTAPYKYKSTPYTKYFTSDDWVKTALDLLGGKTAPGEFRYAPIVGPDILSAILEKTTGSSVLAFANENLFAPLNIPPRHSFSFHSKEEQFEWYNKKKYDGDWIAGPGGVNTAGWGLTLTVSEMAKLGQLYLNGGSFGGRQIISRSWIEESTSEHSRWRKPDLAFGYLWWRLDENCFAAMGDGGNVIYIDTSKNLVAAIASLFVPRTADRIALIREHLIPLFGC